MTHRRPVLGGVHPLAALAPPARGLGVAPACAPGGRGVCFASGGTEKRETTMLRIYEVCLQIVRMLRPYAERIAKHDRDLSRQLKRASVQMVLNVAEGSGTRAGRRRNTY